MFDRLGQKDLKMAAALGAIYIVWGSTYLAIKVVVHTTPPLFAAGVRFLSAGLLLYGWARLRGTPPPAPRQWPRLWSLGALMFLLVYSMLFWAEQTVPSGIASVLVATLPAWVVLLEIIVLRTQRLTVTLAAALTLGLGGVFLLARDPGSARTSLHWLPCCGILLGEISWAAGSVLSRRMSLPAAPMMNGGAQMICGGILLLIGSGIAREFHRLSVPSLPAAVGLVYLILAGSVAAYTAYVWLLERMAPSRLASFAYVNPMVALWLGWWIGGERWHAGALFGSTLILASVILILKHKAHTPVCQPDSAPPAKALAH
jgi:drug/metabolite transporter (DMT)-like permease